MEMTQSQFTKLQIMFGLSDDLAELSTCTQNREAALLVDGTFRSVLGIGYSGSSRYMSNNFCETLIRTRAKKFAGRVCTCAPAAANLLANLAASGAALRVRPKSAWLICTSLPSAPLATALINTGLIARVFCRHQPTALESNTNLLIKTKGIFENEGDIPVHSFAEVQVAKCRSKASDKLP